MGYMTIIQRFFMVGCLALSLVGCKTHEEELHRDKTKERDNKNKRERREERTRGYIFDEPIFSTAPSKKSEASGIGVNAYAWKASLEAISFMPKRSLDPFGGVLITDWYVNPESPQERLRVEILILGRTLRSDAVKVAIFRQIQNSRKEWVEGVVAPETIQDFEETILTRAREMKIADEKR